ncbi:MAG: hypothetical protein AAFQ42_07010 [Pseudomonadota bacterium]
MIRWVRDSFFVGITTLLMIVTVDVPSTVGSWGPEAKAGSAVLGGRRVSCRYGKVIFNDKLPDLGMATRGTIWLNRKLLRKYSGSFQQFVFLHECAHQYTFDEAEADCWAIKRGVYRGLFSSASINNICKVMKNWKGGLWHNTGPNRCAAIKQCFQVAKSRGKRGNRRSGIGSQ